MNIPNHLARQLLLDRHRQFRERIGYQMFISEIIKRTNLVSTPFLMTASDIEQWNEYFTEWELLTEAEKCSYDTFAALEQA